MPIHNTHRSPTRQERNAAGDYRSRDPARQAARGRTSGYRRRMKTLARDRRIVAARLRGDTYTKIAEDEGLSPSTAYHVCNRAAIYIRWRQWQNRMIAARRQGIRRTLSVCKDSLSLYRKTLDSWSRERDDFEEWRPPDDDRPAFIAPPLTLAEAHPRARA